MKTLFSIALLAVALVSTGNSQTNQPPAEPPLIEGPVGTILDFIRNGSNWVVAPYGIYSTGSKDVGAGIAGLVKVNEFLLTGLRLDYIGNGDEVWMPSFSVQLQIPINLGKVTLRPLVTSGIATVVAGKNDDNGEPVGIFGAGLAINITERLGIFGHYEKWTGFEGNQIRAGFYWKF